ncbi:MAG: hypothetical protein NC102_11550 [Clostridium sp.]|nr:hypothetical protein [Clostridium sp.]
MKKFYIMMLAIAVTSMAALANAHKPIQKAGRSMWPGASAHKTEKTLKAAKPSTKAKAASRAEEEYDWQPLWPNVLSFIHQGSVSSPVEIELDDEFNIPEDVIGADNYGFGGGLLYEAGEGVLMIKYFDEAGEEGMLWTPDVTPGDILCVEYDVRTAEEGITDYEVDFVLCSYSGALDFFTSYDVSDQWQTMRYIINTSEYDASDGMYCQLWPYAEREGDEHDILVRNLNVRHVPLAPLDVVSDINMSLNADGDIAVKWSAVDRANYYTAEVGRIHPVAASADFNLINADFSSMESDGTLDSPVNSQNLIEQYDALPGALFILPAFINGAVGLQDDYFYNYFMGYAPKLESGVYDLSAVKDSEIRFSLNMCSANAADLTAVLYNWDDAKQTWTLADSFVKALVPSEFSNVEFTLAGGSERSFFAFFPSGGDDYDYTGNLFFRSIKADVTIADNANQIALPLMSTEGEETEFVIESPIEGDTYSVIITPYIIDESFDVTQRGEESEPAYFTVPHLGINDAIAEPESDSCVYYNLQGIKVESPASGAYIEVKGKSARKVVIR